MKSLVYAMIALMALTACQPMPEKEDIYSKWYGSATTSQTIEGKTESLTQKLSCRKMSSDKKTHVYYEVSVNPETQSVDGTTMTYSSGSFSITRVDISENKTSYKLMMVEAIEFKMTMEKENLMLLHSVAKQDVSKDVRQGQDILTVSEYFGGYDNQTDHDVPGLSKNEHLECHLKD